MARQKITTLRKISADYKFNDFIIAKFINIMMLNGKKSVNEKIMYGALDKIKEKGHENPVDFFKKSLDNVKPLVEVRSRRFGGSTYQVPTEIRENRRMTLGMRWLIQGARKRNNKGMVESLTSELIDAYEQKGFAFKKKEDAMRMAQANKAFSHFRW